MQWLRTLEPFKLDKWLFSEACKSGHLEVLKWLRSEGCPWSADACSDAASGGNFEALKWLRSEGFPWDEAHTLAAAEQGGHLDVIEWALTEIVD